MLSIKYLNAEDIDFWISLDKHISKSELELKIRDQRGYVLFLDNQPVGILRYNLFWDNVPFCTMLYIKDSHQHSGYGKKLMEHWEKDMKSRGHEMLMTSTQSDEDAQHFYRKLKYIDSGSLLINIPKFSQPMEIIFIKEI